MGTKSSGFGVSRRQSHDATAFYERFPSPVLAPSDEVAATGLGDEVRLCDARDRPHVPTGSVALEVTSPPYFSGKVYESEVGAPTSYAEYLGVLEDAFAETYRTLEPGGRLAANIANLGRRPFRSLTSDVWDILARVGFLARAELVWVKAAGAAGNCAWGSWCSPAGPSHRDLTERILVAQKGQFTRALNVREREAAGLPHVATITPEEFMAWTLDTWFMAPESAKRVGHAAPFPVELPRRLARLYTWEGDTIADPFCGSGTTGLAAREQGRRFLCSDNHRDSTELATKRLGL